MRAITVDEAGGPEAMRWTEVADPVPGAGEVLIEVAASAVNRADLLQREGNYPPPPGASPIMGLECSGRIAAVGPGVVDLAVGDAVCALLAGGGYAEKVVVPAAQVMPVPAGIELVTAAALPEVACTFWSNVVRAGRLVSGETLLIHGGTSGVGTHAIQVAKALGARVIATAGAPDRLARCRALGADAAIDYRGDVRAEVLRLTDGRGADVILDNVGAPNLAANIGSLALDGRLLIIGMQGGAVGELDIAALMAKRGSVAAMGLRSRPTLGASGKGEICAAVVREVWPMVAAGRVRPVVHATFPMSRAAEAHAALERGGVVGKLLLVRD